MCISNVAMNEKVHMVIAEFSFKLKKFKKSRNFMEIYFTDMEIASSNDIY